MYMTIYLIKFKSDLVAPLGVNVVQDYPKHLLSVYFNKWRTCRRVQSVWDFLSSVV